MQKINTLTNTISSIAMLALAALPIAALATGAQAAPASVKVADLNLASQAGVTAFNHRAESAPDPDHRRLAAHAAHASSPVNAMRTQSSVRRSRVLNLCAPMILASLAELVTRLLQPFCTRICPMFCSM